MRTANIAAPPLARSAADEESWLRMRRVLNAARGMFALILVESQLSTVESQSAFERLEAELASLQLTLLTVNLSHQKWDALAELERALGKSQNPPDVVLLRGLEETPLAPIGSDPYTRPPAFARLNLAREAVERRLEVPLVVWCTPASFTALRSHAPDFFDHFAGIVRFERPDSPKPALVALPEEKIGLSIDAEAPRDAQSSWEAYQHLLDRGTDDPEEYRRWSFGRAFATAALEEPTGGQLEEALNALDESSANAKLDLEERARYRLARGLLTDILGRRTEAAESLEEAARSFRELSRERPDSFLPPLAYSLDNLARTLSSLGRLDEAHEAASEAVEILRVLAQEHRHAFLPNLADNLENLGDRLIELGHVDDGLESRREAASLLRSLTKDRPGEFIGDLARSLNNLGVQLGALSRNQEALNASAEAVDIYRSLAAQRPDSYLPTLGGALSNLRIRLSAVGRQEDALEAAHETVEIYRRLASDRPETFAASLGTALLNSGAQLEALGRPQEALVSIQEAVNILKKLSKEQPSQALPIYSTALAGLGVQLAALDRHQEALETLLEAVQISRQLTRERPVEGRPLLGLSLLHLGTQLASLGQFQEMADASQEAVSIYQELFEEGADQVLPLLARAHLNASIGFAGLGQESASFQAVKEAAATLKSADLEQKYALLPLLVAVLGSTGNRLLAAMKADQAQAAFEEGLNQVLPLAAEFPESWEDIVAALVIPLHQAAEATGKEPNPSLLRHVADIYGEGVLPA